MAIKRVFLLPPSPTTTIKRALQAVISFLFPSHPPFLQGVGWVVFYTAYGKVFWASVPSLIAHRSPIKKKQKTLEFFPLALSTGAGNTETNFSKFRTLFIKKKLREIPCFPIYWMEGTHIIIYSFIFLGVYTRSVVHSSVWALNFFPSLKKKNNSILCKCCLWFQVVHSLQFMNSLRLFSGLRRDSPENLKPSQFSLFYTVCDFVPVSSMQWMLMICLQVGQWCLCVKALTVCCWFTFWLGWTCYAKGGHFSLFN